MTPTSVIVALLFVNVWSMFAAMPTVNVPLLLEGRVMPMLELLDVTYADDFTSHVEAVNEPLTALEPPITVAVLTDMLGFLACFTVNVCTKSPSTVMVNVDVGSVVVVEAGTLTRTVCDVLLPVVVGVGTAREPEVRTIEILEASTARLSARVKS